MLTPLIIVLIGLSVRCGRFFCGSAHQACFWKPTSMTADPGLQATGRFMYPLLSVCSINLGIGRCKGPDCIRDVCLQPKDRLSLNSGQV